MIHNSAIFIIIDLGNYIIQGCDKWQSGGGTPPCFEIKVGRFGKKLAGLGEKLAGLGKKLAGFRKKLAG